MAARPGTVNRWYAARGLMKRYARPGMRVLDLGGFDGFILSSLARDVDLRGVVFDADTSGAASAMARGFGFASGDATALPVADASMDMVLCMDLIEHVENDAAVLSEAGRVLKPGGILFLSTPDADRETVPGVDMEEVHNSWGHVRPGYRPADLLEMLGSSGFEVLLWRRYFNVISKHAYRQLLFARGGKVPARVKNALFRLGNVMEPWFRVGATQLITVSRKKVNP